MPALRATLVDFPAGALTGRATVQIVRPHGDRTAVVTDRTPFHPVDHGWPDQGPDRGTLTLDGSGHEVVDCVLGATDGITLFIGQDIPVRRGTPGWEFLVVHLLDDEVSATVGQEVELEVDGVHRRALSAGHTACHLASLALNAALTDRWNKPVPADGLGHPDFDKLALDTSRIVEHGAVDTYRLGKSLRRKGFDSTTLADDLAAVQEAADDLLERWVSGGGRVAVEVTGPALTDLRHWVCDTVDGQVRIPCGGTHLNDLGMLGSIRVTLDLQPDQLTMTTTATPVS